MVQSKRRKGKKKLLDSHQRCWVWGRHVVAETLTAGKWPILELYLDQGLSAENIEAATGIAEKLRIPVKVESSKRLLQLCHTSEHQGYLAKMSPFPYSDALKILSRFNTSQTPLFAILDSLQDPYNFGAIIRSAEVMGVNALFICEKAQVGVTSMVARSSAGAVNRIEIAQVPDLIELARKMQERGIALVGTGEKGITDVCDYDFQQPAAVVLGNEGMGITGELLALCDAQIRIPQQGAIGSLNVAAAAAIIFYEAQRQRHDEK